ncbi:endonuclease III [Parvularcula sp. IMCC14364]|uniref:endonuclease III domain-containing protein n=1 Tax=Parvularcula sp. IMCC14364 TaxID=3067902 RepID=UPI00274156D3|nr:hypothetical protein [Parvularcula sp. IMCC14364]
MQEVLFSDARSTRLAAVDRRLTDVIALSATRQDRLSPAHQLVLSMLGNRTYDHQSRAAYTQLLAAFGSLENLSVAPAQSVMPHIAAVNFADIKAARIPAALRQIRAAGDDLDMTFLACLPVSVALSWLGSIKGVGRKVAAAVLNFSTLQMPALVLDSHHLRVCARLRIIPEHYSAERAYDLLMPLLPAHWTAADIESHHVKIKILGQQVCHHAQPKCPVCPVRALCPSAGVMAQTHTDSALARAEMQNVTEPAVLTGTVSGRQEDTESGAIHARCR